MIIRDKQNNEHFIRIKGKEKMRIKTTDFQIIGTNAQVEAVMKLAIDQKVGLDGYHAYVYVWSKNPLGRRIWLGPTKYKPAPDWKD